MSTHEVVALIGASGSGKWTLLRCIDLLDNITLAPRKVHRVARQRAEADGGRPGLLPGRRRDRRTGRPEAGLRRAREQRTREFLQRIHDAGRLP